MESVALVQGKLAHDKVSLLDFGSKENHLRGKS